MSLLYTKKITFGKEFRGKIVKETFENKGGNYYEQLYLSDYFIYTKIYHESL
jgi:hypothetical protein